MLTLSPIVHLDIINANQKPDHLRNDLLSTIWKPDTSGFRMPTVVESYWVPDSCRENHHWNFEFRILVSIFCQLQNSLEGLKSANQQESTDFVFAQCLGNCVELSLWKITFGSQQSPTHGRPAIDSLPRHSLNVTVDQALHTVVDSQRIVSWKLRVLFFKINLLGLDFTLMDWTWQAVP